MLHISMLSSPFSTVDDLKKSNGHYKKIDDLSQYEDKSAEDLGKSRKIGIAESASPIGER